VSETLEHLWVVRRRRKPKHRSNTLVRRINQCGWSNGSHCQMIERRNTCLNLGAKGAAGDLSLLIVKTEFDALHSERFPVEQCGIDDKEHIAKGAKADQRPRLPQRGLKKHRRLNVNRLGVEGGHSLDDLLPDGLHICGHTFLPLPQHRFDSSDHVLKCSQLRSTE
jgi:hypothetical protein